MRLYWDITKASKNRVYSGLNRVSQRLQRALEQAGCRIVPVAWSTRNRAYLEYPSREPIAPTARDAFVTSELFSEHERPGVGVWMETCRCPCLAIYHDAIPLKHPEFTWPQSVARHPYYLKELAGFDAVLANSEHSRKELLAYWQWLNLASVPPVRTIPLGADFAGDTRVATLSPEPGLFHLLMVGILEPRKNHDVVLSALEILRTQGKQVQLSIVGRMNPHFGKPVVKRIEALIERGLPIRYHRQVDDVELLELFQKATLTLFPSLAEGNGLPVIESLWRGVPTVASPIPPHMEHAARGGGVLIVDPMEPAQLAAAIDVLMDEPGRLRSLREAALQHQVPTWADAARATLAVLDALPAASRKS
jgi:glycosyltransferase involved in cell wall biosynthesis